MQNDPGRHRFVVDEATFLAHDTSQADLETALDNLSDQLASARIQDELVAIVSDFDTVQCGELQLHEVLTSDGLSRDCRVRAYGLLDKCSRFDADPLFVLDPDVDVDGTQVESYALAYALAQARETIAVGVLVLVARYGPGEVTVSDTAGSDPAWIIVDRDSRIGFYRSIFAVEDIREDDFFAHTAKAFPNLCFAPGLTFRRFDGSYQELRSTVIEHLSALSDRLRQAMAQFSGMSDDVSAAVGVTISLEGSATRKSEKLMRERDIEFEGNIYRCEWHSKLEPHRNRIHVHVGDAGTNHRALIGIFVDHLPT